MAKTDDSAPAEERAERSAKEVWGEADMEHWAAFMGLDIHSIAERFNARKADGSPGHPISAVKMLRGLLIAAEEGEDALARFAFVSFDAYWGAMTDVSDDAELRAMHGRAGLSIDAQSFLDRLSNDESIKAQLRHNTDEVIDRGGFGSPSIFVSSLTDPDFQTQMHFGNDRMELVEAAILRAQRRPWRWHERHGGLLPGPLRHDYERQFDVVRISTRLGEVLLWLYDETPKHKASFLALIEEGYWDDYCFNRVVQNFVAQAGCPDTEEGFGYCVHLLEPEIRPGPAFRHTRGALGAGRDDNPEKLSAACQFYVCQAGEEITRTIRAIGSFDLSCAQTSRADPQR